MQPRNIIIDCDTGVDDALALLLALRSPVFNVLGITMVAGNVTLEKVIRNTLVVVEHACKEVPVFAGAYRPLVGTWTTAENAHGSDGLGNIGFPDPRLKAEEEHAVDYLVRAFMEAEQPFDLITLAPLTNVALALHKEPRLTNRIRSLLMMAGGIQGGNVTPAAEFNVWVDPEAADLVFRSGIPMKMVPLEPIYSDSGIPAEDVEQLQGSDSPWCSMAASLLSWQLGRFETFTGTKRPATPPDLAAVGVAIDPTIAQSEMHPVAVECRGEHTRGMTVVDTRWYARLLPGATSPNVDVVTTIDNQRYRKLVLDTLLAQ
jgi:inosine-uridine nucleoside N-ribohydrolase